MPIRIPYILLLSILCFHFLSCTKTPSGEEDFTPLLSLDKKQIVISGLAHAKDSFAIESTTSWDISMDPASASWLLLDARNGQKNRKVIVASIESNTTGADRTATLTITPTATPAVPPITVTVIQRTVSLSDSAAALIGRWQYIRDSSTNIGNYYFMENGTPWVPIAGVYWGYPQDYWEFRVDGSTQFHGNNNTYNDVYKLHLNSRLEFMGLNAHDTAYIRTFTADELIFYFDNTSPNGGKYHRSVFLKR